MFCRTQVACNYTESLLRACCEQLTARMQAKAPLLEQQTVQLFPFTLSRLLLRPGTIKFDDCGKKLRSSGWHAWKLSVMHLLLALCPSGFVSYLYRREREIQIQEPVEKIRVCLGRVPQLRLKTEASHDRATFKAM